MARFGPETAWSPAEALALEADWRAGLTSFEIALRLGRTPGEVRGKRHHLGLKSRRADGGEAEAAIARQTGLKRRNPHPGAPKEVADADRMRPLPGSTPRPWGQRMRGECSFPVDGDLGEVLSCCLPSVGPYCERHRLVMRGDA